MGIVHPLLLPLAVGIAALAWRAVVQRGTRLRDGALRLDRWAYWVGFVTLSLMITLPLPFVQSSVDGATRTPGLALYLQEVATLCTCWCWLSYLALIEGTRSRWQPAIFGGLAVLVIAAAAFMGLRFSLAPGHGDIARLGPGADLPTRYLAAQRLTYRAVMLLHAVYGSRLLRRYSAVVRSRPALWARMRAMIWVLDFMILYAVYECLTILCPPLPDFGNSLNRLRAYLMVLVLAVPSGWYAHAVARVERWTGYQGPFAGFGTWRLHRRIFRLWRALRPVDPGRSLGPPPARFAAWVPQADFPSRLCDELMEIRDWSLALRRYVPAKTTYIATRVAAGANIPVADLSAFIEAATFAAGLRAWQRAKMIPGQGIEAIEPGYEQADTLAEEAVFLARVADFFVHSPLVSAVLTRLGDEGLDAYRLDRTR